MIVELLLQFLGGDQLVVHWRAGVALMRDTEGGGGWGERVGTISCVECLIIALIDLGRGRTYA